MVDRSPPQAPTALGQYRVLSPSAGIRVSPLQLGGLSIGDAWNDFFGPMKREQAFELLDAFESAGGNFIDTSNNYQNEQSESWIGEWMEQKGNRDRMVIATKFSTPYTTYSMGKGNTLNHAGNHKRSLLMSLRDSLRKLKTDWIDILYVHWWDWTTSIEELMDSLDAVVKSNKVLYLGISNTPAYIVSAANMYARAHGKTPFSIYQGRWNLLVRDLEREIIPMCRQFGMAIAPWEAMGGGKFKTKQQIEERSAAKDRMRGFGDKGLEQSENEVKVSEALGRVAERHGKVSPTAVALAYVMSKAPYVFPIIGGRRVEQMQGNIKALELKLTPDDIAELESAVPFDLGFPVNFIGEDPHLSGEPTKLLGSVAEMSFVRHPRAIGSNN